MQPFVYNALPARVIFGWGTSSQVAQEVKKLGCVRRCSPLLRGLPAY